MRMLFPTLQNRGGGCGWQNKSQYLPELLVAGMLNHYHRTRQLFLNIQDRVSY